MAGLADAIRASASSGRPAAIAGIYDVFSATLAAPRFDGIFVSGFGVTASHYGLPDVGLISWPEIVALTQRLRAVLPETPILVDIDDGYGDPTVAAHAVKLLESAGASGVVLEDQRRPKKCGHLDGKRVLELDAFLDKLDRVLGARSDLFVVARTDADTPDERLRRAAAFGQTAADAILVDGLDELAFLSQVRGVTDKPLAFNQISGGRGARFGWSDLASAGVSMVLYSTPCLFAAQRAIERELEALREAGGVLPEPDAGLAECNRVLDENLARRLEPRPTTETKDA